MKAILAREPVGGLPLLFGDYNAAKRELPAARGAPRQSCVTEHLKAARAKDWLFFAFLPAVSSWINLLARSKPPSSVASPSLAFFSPVNGK